MSVNIIHPYKEQDKDFQLGTISDRLHHALSTLLPFQSRIYHTITVSITLITLAYRVHHADHACFERLVGELDWLRCAGGQKRVHNLMGVGVGGVDWCCLRCC